MRHITRTVALLSLSAATTVGAQGSPPSPGARRGAPAAQMLLSRTGELELTDAQVVRLAAIARRSEARRRAMRATMDSARVRFDAQPGDTVARRQFRQRMQTDLQRAEEQLRTDQRDAIAVLTPDQQAKAWNMVSNLGSRMRGGRDMRGPRGLRRMPGERGRNRMDAPRGTRRSPDRIRVPRPPRPAEDVSE
jgi:Spy/CpxP family protein refolding chaperone